MKEFTIDWKFSVEEIIENIKEIFPNFPVKFMEEKQEYGDFYEVVEVKGSEYKFKVDTSYGNLEKIMDFMNKHLPNKKQRFVIVPPGDDNYTYRLEEMKKSK